MKRGVKTLMLTNIQAIDIVIGIESFASPDAPEGGVRELKADYPSLSKILLLLDEDEVEVDYRDEDICAWSGCDGLRTPGSGKVEEAMRAWTRSTRYTHQDVCCEWTWASFERFCGERGLGWEVVEGVWVEGGVGRGRRSERVRRKHCLFPGYIWSAGRIVDE